MRRYAPLLDHFRSKGYRFIDIQDADTGGGSQPSAAGLYSKNGWHFSPAGNTVVAQYVVSQLQQWNLTDPVKLQQAAQAERARLSVALR